MIHVGHSDDNFIIGKDDDFDHENMMVIMINCNPLNQLQCMKLIQSASRLVTNHDS